MYNIFLDGSIIIGDLVKAWKVEGGLIVLGVIFYSLIKTKFINTLLTKLFDHVLGKLKKRNRKSVSEESLTVNDKDILHHDIFPYIDFWISSNIPSMVFFTEFRTAVFKKYLIIFFRTYRDELKLYIELGDFKKMNKPELKQSLLKLLTAIVNKYESDMKGQMIPPVVISKMKTKNNEALNLIMDLINSICDSHFYDTEDNLLKMYSFMNIILAVLENVINATEEVCNSINGEMKGLTMDGFTEPSK